MKKSNLLIIFAIIFSLIALPQFTSLGLGAPQQPETAWVVWETDTPAQWSGPSQC